MNTSVTFTILVIAFIAACSALPQWRPIRVDRLDSTGIRLSKDYGFNNGKSSIGGIGGYDKTNGIGLGVQGSHTFNQGTGVSGSLFKTQNGGTLRNFGISYESKGPSIIGSSTSGKDFNSKTLEVRYDFPQGTSVIASSKNSNYGGIKVKDQNIRLSKTLDSGTSIDAYASKTNDGEKKIGLEFKIPLNN